jgi:hypothetical protein
MIAGNPRNFFVYSIIFCKNSVSNAPNLKNRMYFAIALWDEFH